MSKTSGWCQHCGEHAARLQPEHPIGVAYETETHIVVCGIPPDLPETHPQYHNCDAMGCGQEHVLYRFPKRCL